MNNISNSSTLPKSEEIKSVTKEKKWLHVLVIALAVLFISVAGYIVYKEFVKDNTTPEDDDTQITQDEDTQNEDGADLVEDNDAVCEVGEEGCEDEEETEESSTTFEGEVISAQLPTGWRIVEYFDGEGTESLPEEMGTYTGLTAIDIINPENLQVFSIQAVSGIGFAGCPIYPLFEDDNESYRLVQEGVSDEMGETLNIVDYTDAEYVEFEFLGVTFRRIDDQYFYDTQEGNNYFEPPCVEGLLTLEGLYFTDEDGYKYEAYFYGPTEDSTPEDLIVVDEILESIELN
jgi:catechol 2,3-dioxygenase-like lactoylglutathione lyase family enzyme